MRKHITTTQLLSLTRRAAAWQSLRLFLDKIGYALWAAVILLALLFFFFGVTIKMFIWIISAHLALGLFIAVINYYKSKNNRQLIAASELDSVWQLDALFSTALELIAGKLSTPLGALTIERAEIKACEIAAEGDIRISVITPHIRLLAVMAMFLVGIFALPTATSQNILQFAATTNAPTAKVEAVDKKRIARENSKTSSAKTVAISKNNITAKQNIEYQNPAHKTSARRKSALAKRASLSINNSAQNRDKEDAAGGANVPSASDNTNASASLDSEFNEAALNRSKLFEKQFAEYTSVINAYYLSWVEAIRQDKK